MVLTFRSTTPESRTIIEQQPDGRQRVAVAVRDTGATNRWELQVRHPSGEHWRGSFTGDNGEVNLALDEMLARTRQDFLQDAARGDQPRSAAPDYNRRITDGVAPVRSIPPRRQ